jgi:hypothetical protein
LLRCLQELPASSWFQVLIFNSQVDLLLPTNRVAWLQTDPQTVQRVREALLSLAASGSTRPFPAVQRALALRPQHIILATDCDDLKAKEIADLTRFNEGRTRIHIIDLQWRPGPEGSGPLRQLAAWNQGSYRQAGVPLR